jgi:two-component system, sensor histidine kinase and response regulator
MTVLCIDDETIVLESLQMELSEALGTDCNIETAQSGQEAIELVAQLQRQHEPVGVIVCDYIMPELKGDETLQRIHAIDPGAVKIMLTGQSSTEGITNAINNANLYRFVSKPWNGKHLVAVVREATNKYLYDSTLDEHTAQLETQNEELQDLKTFLEHQVSGRTRELQEINAQLIQLNEELVQSNKLKTKLMSVVSHDLKNPLHGIQMLASILTTDEVEPKQHVEMLTMIHHSADRMMELVKDLLDSAAVELGHIQIQPYGQLLSELVQQVCNDFITQIGQKNQRLVRELAADCPVSIDGRRFRQVAENLLSNAIKYSPYETTITARVRQLNGKARLEVKDEGPGLNDEDKSKLFGFFQRLSAQPTGGEPSTGVGLAIVKQIVELHEGKVWCESEQGSGATFIVELPLYQTNV